MAFLVGSFLGTMALPAILLLFSRSTSGREWLRGVAIAVPLLAIYGAGSKVDAGEILALLVTLAWAGIQSVDFKVRSINGWQRLFVVIAALICIPATGAWLYGYPGENDSNYAPGCYDYGISYIRHDEAVEVLAARRQTLSIECAASLEAIAEGRAREAALARWRSSFMSGATAIGIFLFALYALGYGLGWVWRGFFPKKPA